MRNKMTLFAGLFLVAFVGMATASIETVAGVTFDTANAVQAATLSTDGTLGHSFFWANVTGGTTDEAHHVGTLLGSSPSYAIDVTGGTNGSAGRNYITLTWGTNKVVENQAGDDFHVYESGSANPLNRGFPELFGVAVREFESGSFTSYRYEFFNGSDVGALKLVTSYDISDFGLASGAIIDAVRVISMHNASSTTPPYLEDRVDNASGEGNVLLDAGSGAGFEISQGPNSDNPSWPAFPDGAMDADIVYVVSTNVTDAPPDASAGHWQLYE